VETALHKHKLSKRIKPALLPGVPQRFSPTPGTAKPALQQISGSKRIFIQEGDNCWIVQVADLMLLESEGNYTRVYFGESNPIIARSLNYMENRLDPTLFFRASRHSIINLKYVTHIEPQLHGGFVVRLQSGSEIEVSRRQGHLLKQNMKH
jgi:two-component system LytT family response regulator